MTHKPRVYQLFTIVFLVFIAFITAKIYLPWFIHADIIGGDWPTIDPGFLKEMHWPPFLWETNRGNGVGGMTPLLNLELYQNVFIAFFVNWIHIPWQIVYKISWFGMFLVLSVLSIWILTKNVFIEESLGKQKLLAAFIFLTNSYTLMLASGGQMGILLAISVSPLVIVAFIKQFSFQASMRERAYPRPLEQLRNSVLTGTVIAAQVLFDPRIAYITLVAVTWYLIIYVLSQRKAHWFFSDWILFLLYGAFIPGIISFLLNSFWLLPTILVHDNAFSQFGLVYTSVGAVKFFSFADFSHAMSLLQPNWPENLFGKTFFLQPEFLLLPVVAYAAILFEKRFSYVHFFALLGIFGTFLAKGSNPPFGELYVWFFRHIPGFVMFRDSTKFYLLIALSYAILIPYSIENIVRIARSNKLKHFLSLIAFVLFTLFWVFTVRQAVFFTLGGTFSDRQIPEVYQTVKGFILNQSGFFRTLWIPSEQRFTPFSHEHPAMSASYLFTATNSAELASELGTEKSRQLLQQLSVKYIVIPYDALGELFLSDRTYDSAQRVELEKFLDSVSWIKKISTGRITVYETPKFNDHFWLDTNGTVSFSMINPAHYRISVSTPTKTTLYFSETYHWGWVARLNNNVILSQKTAFGLNSFSLSQSGTYTGDVYFQPERIARAGFAISGISFLFILLYVAISLKKPKTI